MGKVLSDGHSAARRIKESGALPAAVLILSKDRTRRERAIRFFLSSPSSPVARIDAKEVTKQSLIRLFDQLRTLSLFSNERSDSVVAPVEDLPSSLAPLCIENLTEITSPSGTIFFSGGQLPASHAFRKFFDAKGLTVSFTPPTPEEMTAWITKEFARLGATSVEPSAVEFLATLTGDNIDAAASYCELAVLSSDDHTISIAAMRALFKSDLDPNDFQFPELLFGRSAPAAQGYLAELFAAGRNPFAFLGLAHRSLVSLYSIKLLLEDGTPTSAISQRLGMPAWLANKQINLVRSVSLDRVRKGVELIARADSLLKNRALTPEDILGELVTSTFKSAP